MSKAADFPKTELEGTEFPKTAVKPLDFFKKELHEFPKMELKTGDFPKMELEGSEFLELEDIEFPLHEFTVVKPLDFFKKELHEFPKMELKTGDFPKTAVKPLNFFKKELLEFPKKELKVGDFPNTELEDSEYPKMEVKPGDFPKMEAKLPDFLKRKPHEFPKKEAYDFPKIEQHTFLEEMLPEKESKGATAFASLVSSKSTISRNSLSKQLMRSRNLMSLLRSYQMRITNDWVIDSLEERYDTKPLTYFAGLIPREIIRDAAKGERSYSISTNDNDLVPPPKSILNLAVDLAVDQLIQTLILISNGCRYQHPHHIKYIRLSAKSDVEKREVMSKIEAALNEEHHMLDILKSFRGILSIDASTYPASAENQFRRHICQQLQLPMTEDDDILCTRCIEEEMSINRYLVLLVDRDGGETIDPRNVGFCKTELAGVLVLITVDSTTAQAKDDELIAELMDLEIQSRDHLLSWELFCHYVGKKYVYASSAILATAERIVEECHGHLLAIVLVAKWLLKNLQDVKHWELALHKILHTNPSYDIQGHLSTIMKNTFLNLIWDSINKAQKHCLLCCLFIPEIRDGKVDCELLNHWISSLFVDAEEAKQNLRKLLHNSVLLQSVRGRYIRLPEETHKILQLIYTLNPLFVDLSGQGLTEPPDTDRWQNASRIKLSDNKLSELPLSPDCMELKVLMLQRNAELTKIPCSFFGHMPQLQIMDLSYTSVRELPRSFFFLEQLRELYLKGCECFMKLPPDIGNLHKLEKLDLDETQITHLPEEVQKLTYMQSLTLYFYEYRGKKNKPYSYPTIIPSGVLSKLKRLKHLSIGVNPDDERWHDNVQVILPEILGLKLLETLSIYIPQLELLKLIPAYLLEEVDFRFIVGHHMQRIISSIPPAIDVKFKQSDRSLKFVKGKDVPAEINKLLRHSKALFLDRHVTIKSLSEFKMENLEELRVCILAECKEMQTIVGRGDSNGNCDILSHLLFLSVSHMKNLRSIWEGPTVPRFLFDMLQSLSLQSCPKLMILFSLDFLGNLSLLKELIVKDCPRLTTLINHESSIHNAYSYLPRLRKLSLLHLPELTSISSGLRIGPWLKEIAFYDCPKLCSLSREELASNALMAIKGETNWWNTLKGRPSEFDKIFIPIHEEADLMTQLGIYNEDDIDNCPGSPMGKPSQLTDVATPVLNSPVDLTPSLKGHTDIKQRNSETWVICSPSLEDGYTWRKYGQKVVLNMKYPRSYYRCTHKFDQACQATKFVQRVDEDPPSFRITYRGHHTCNVQHNIPPLNLDSVHESVTESNYMGKHTDPNSCRPFEGDAIFIPIHEEADVMTQSSIYDDGDIDDCPGGPMGEPSQPTDVATPVLYSPPDLTPSLKGRRNIKQRNSETWVICSPSLDDGYTWRKYGQKVVLNMKYPRSYYRCTHKFDQACQATKFVQRVDEDPPSFRITYRGHHTCNVQHNIPPLNLDSVHESVTESNYMGKHTDPNSCQPFEGDAIFIPIHEEADVMTQSSIYDDGDIDDCPGGPMGEPSQPTDVATPVLYSPPDLTPSLKGRRNIKQRKTLPRWTKQVRVKAGMGVEGPLDDGFSWKKCGQKDILGAMYPRAYYRCTHRNVRGGCLATKQVQRSDEDPSVFEITYSRPHTCTVGSSSNAVPATSPKENQDSNLNTRGVYLTQKLVDSWPITNS